MPKNRKNLLLENLEAESVIYDKQTKKIYRLDETIAPVFQKCDGTTSRAEVAAELYAGEAEGLNKLDAALLALEEQGLLEEREVFSASRRAFLRKAAVFAVTSSAILGMTAPPAAQAQSAAPDNGPPGGGNQLPPDFPPNLPPRD